MYSFMREFLLLLCRAWPTTLRKRTSCCDLNVFL
jgi:hypothetical protein